MVTQRTVRIEGLEELQKKLDGNVLIQPELQDALETISTRFKRGGKGLGAKRNTVLATVHSPMATITTTRNWPRTKGTAWLGKEESIFKGMVPRVIAKMFSRIKARWDA